jgi:Uma2 family endonuclease
MAAATSPSLKLTEIEAMLPATFTVPGLTEAGFLEFCEKFPEDFLEYTPDGTLIIMPPTDPMSAVKVYEVGFQFGLWNRTHDRGLVFGPDGGFFFPSGSRRSPDACWFDAARWKAAETPGMVFPVFAPEFLIEVRSPHDRLNTLQAKMEEYIENGVQLAWLIDPKLRQVTIYRPGQAPQTLENPTSITADGPVAGFQLSLDRIFTS